MRLHGNILITTSCLSHPCGGNRQNPSMYYVLGNGPLYYWWGFGGEGGEGKGGGREKGEGGKRGREGRGGEGRGEAVEDKQKKVIPMLCQRLVHWSLLEHCLLISLRRLRYVIGLLPSQRNTTKTTATITTMSIRRGKLMCKGASPHKLSVSRQYGLNKNNNIVLTSAGCQHVH